MNTENNRHAARTGRHRRWLLGLEPIFEGGWLHKGARARTWDVEPELIGVALLGDVTVDLAAAHSLPAEIVINAWAIFRDVDVLVVAGDRVDLTGGGGFGDLTNEVPKTPDDGDGRAIHIRAHSLFGDVTSRITPAQS